LWPQECEGVWVLQWNKYGDWRKQPERLFIPVGMKRDVPNTWGKWWASEDFDYLSESQEFHKSMGLLDIPPGADLQFMNGEYGSDVLIGHFGAQTIWKYHQIIDRFVHTKVSVPDNIAIMTFATDNIADQALLLRQLKSCGIPFTNLADYVYNKLALPRDKKWSHRYKFVGVSNYVPTIKQKYVLILDGVDTLLLRSLDTIVERFEAHGKDVMFNAQTARWPREAQLAGEEDINYGKYRYLNSGVAFGRTMAMADFWRRAGELAIENKIWNDQLPCRMAFLERRGSVGLDYQCSMFQNVNGMRYKNDMLVIY